MHVANTHRPVTLKHCRLQLKINLMYCRAGQSLARAGTSTRIRFLEFLIYYVSAAGRRTFSQSATRRSYADTIQNLRIRGDTRVLCQGFTGKTVRWIVLILKTFLIYQVTGHFPYKRSFGVWNEHGWRRISQESRSDSSRSSRLWDRKRGRSPPHLIIW